MKYIWLLRTSLAALMLSISGVSSAIPMIAITDLTDAEPSITLSGLSNFLPCIVIPESLTCFISGFVPSGTIFPVNSYPAFALTEGPEGAAAILSDFFSLSIGVDPSGAFSVVVHLSSDVPIAPGVDDPIPRLVDCTQPRILCKQETGGIQNFTVFVPGAVPGTEFALFDLAVQSDIDTPPTSTPEPTTSALIGIGLAGFGFLRRKQT